MDDLIYLPSAALTALLIVSYLFRELWAKRKPVLANALSLALAAPGVVAGIVLVASTFYPPFAAKLTNLKLYIFVAGFVLIWHAVAEIARRLSSAGVSGAEPIGPKSESQTHAPAGVTEKSGGPSTVEAKPRA